MKQYDESKETAGLYPVQALKGQYVKRNEAAKKVYRVAEFDRTYKQWQLDDVDDISRCIYVKPGTKLYAGFSY